MELRTFSFVVVFGGLAILSLGSPLPESTAFGDVTPSIVDEQVLLACENSDYRMYIKCLRRQKRHPLTERHAEPDPHCLESCMKLCDGDQTCDHCRRCLKRTKHRHQIITEYESECNSGECKPAENEPASGLTPTNITTKIDINNVINTCTPWTPGCPYPGGGNRSDCCPHCQPPTPCTPPAYPPAVPPYGGNLPHLQLVPQLTLGLGLAPSFTGWQYPSQWPQQPPPQIPSGHPIDCSSCGHPFLHYRCHISCHHEVHYPHVSTNYTCHSPYCVGGSQS